MWPSSREVRRSSIACPPGCSLPASTDEDGAPRKGHPPPHNLRLLSHFMFPLDCPAASGCGRDYAPTSSRARLCFCAERGSAILLQVRAKQIKKKVAMRRDAKSLRPPFGMKNGDGQGALAGGSGSSSSGGGGSGRSRGPVTEYAASQRILVLGDGDFSFARGAYALQPGPEPHRADRAASPATPPPRAALNGPRPRPAGLVRHCGSGANITATSFDSLKQVRRPLRAARRAARLRRAAPRRAIVPRA